MYFRLLAAFLIMLSAAFADQERSSRLSYVRPGGWTHAISDQTGLGSILTANGGVVVTFMPSAEYSGTAEQWQQEKWTGVLQRMKLAGPSQAGVQGRFLTRTGVFNQPDGSRPWVCVYTLVSDGRGEGVVYVGANEALFLSQLRTVNQLVQHISLEASPENGATATEARAAVPRPLPDSSSAVSSVELQAMNPPSNAQETEPFLTYDEPPQFYRGASKLPFEYSSTEVNASIRVYPFRPFSGNVQTLFEQTMLREWVDPRYRETTLSGPPQFSLIRVPGATSAFSARFHETIVGLRNERMRMLIVAGERAALVDVTANSTYSWQKAGPSARVLLDSLKVGVRAAPPSVAEGPGPAGKAFAGLYLGSKTKYMVNLNRAVGFGDTKLALHYYIFTADGRVHRCYDFPPGGEGRSGREFDFARAQNEDPQNTGRYTLRGNRLFIQMASATETLIEATVKDEERLEIETITYIRQH